MKIVAIALVVGLAARLAFADTPELSAWILNHGETGFGGITANVTNVRCSDANVWVNATGIPAYDIGPWAGNPNTPSNQNALYKIPRQPSEQAGTKTATPLGRTGTWINGVGIFNAKDAFSYQNEGTWNQNAVVVEGPSMDACLGHPAPGGLYHHHQNPKCLYNDYADTHSPILGFAWDGVPIYGPRGYASAAGKWGVTRMKSSYRLRSITQRHSLPDGTVLSQNLWGPDVSSAYPLGYYIEDYEFVEGLGHLDRHNGRFEVTPEYPDGVYAYYVTIDESGASAYPYVMGPTYWGIVERDNFPPGGATVDEPVEDCRASAPAVAIEYAAKADGLTIAFRDASTGSPTSWQWNFGDGSTSRERNPIYSFATPGLKAVRLTAANGAGSGTSLAAVEVEYPTAPGVELVLPAAVRSGGAGTYFRSRIDAHNASSSPLACAVKFVPRVGTSGDSQAATITFLPHETISLDDPFAEWFGLFSGDLVGAIYLEAISGDPAALALQSRIVAANPDGSEFGQFFPALDRDDFIDAGETAWIPGPLSPERSRLNVGLMALEDGTTIEIRPVGPIGTGLAAKQSFALDAGQSQQVNDVATTFGLGAREHWLVQLSVLTGSAVAYGSELDGNSSIPGTNDPTTLSAFRAGASEVTLLEIGSAQGFEEYAGRVLVANLGDQSVDVTATFYPRGQSGGAITVPSALELAAGEIETTDFEGLDIGVGTLVLDGGSGSQLAAIGREYSIFRDASVAISGTAGQRMPGLTADDRLFPGATYHLIGLRQESAGSGGERSHLAVFNPGTASTTLRVRLYDADSGVVEGSDTYSIGAKTLLQWNEIIAKLAPTADDSAKRLEIVADAAVYAAAFRVNPDGDPVTIEPMREP